MSVADNLETLTLTLEGGGDSGEDLEYTMSVLVGVDNTQTKDALSIAPPGQSAAQNILLGIQGQQADRTATWFVHDDGTDKSNGTAGFVSSFPFSTVETIAEQRRWLEDVIHAPDFDASWTLNHDGGDHFDNQTVFVERINVPSLQQDSPKWVEARMDLRRGQSI